ncbi:peptide ABC transporter permease [Falsochrobactrum shanghaiense]|uniref:Peptide ABC transporter permease n=1 Tax=Falsochrobactrum shanghaiense TaxID=2201899 RepID=A0A316J5A8_9HYPH|nr:ABC transporter permease [Falsochrobactrum shanghaiense]PWL16511.1 peptide ABC transporter permease [Falsochrobactrum shanghaiense]
MADTQPLRPTTGSTIAGVRRKIASLRLSAMAVVCLTILFLFILLALFSSQFAPYDPVFPDLRARLVPPAWSDRGTMKHILGTDQLGRDMLSRLIYGSRIALLVGFLGVIVAAFIGTVVGLIAGFAGGKLDAVLMAFVNTLLAVPNTLLYLTVLAVFGQSLTLLIIIIGCINWTTFARVVRGEVLSVKRREFIEASRAIGQLPAITMVRHVLPNVIGPIIVIATMNVAMLIILEATLSFLGFGVQPPTVTWGRMLADGRNYVATAWWLAAFPGLTITLLTLSLIFLGDWLRDRLDPRNDA